MYITSRVTQGTGSALPPSDSKSSCTKRTQFTQIEWGGRVRGFIYVCIYVYIHIHVCI